MSSKRFRDVLYLQIGCCMGYDLFKMTVSGVLEWWSGKTDGLTDMTSVAVVLTPDHHTVALVTLQVSHHKLPV